MDRKGFSLVETVLAVTITIVIGLIVIANFSQRKGTSDLDVTTREIASFLRQAQTNAVNGIGTSGWGVHFDNPTSTFPSYTFFEGGSYSATATGKQTFRLPASISYDTSTVPVGPDGRTIVFQPVSGAIYASTVFIRLYLIAQPDHSSTIAVSPTGAVSF